jgi:hypothetical protein
MDKIYEIMRAPLVTYANEAAEKIEEALQDALIDAEVAGAVSNEVLSIGSQIVAAQVLLLVERLLKRAEELAPGGVPNTVEFRLGLAKDVLGDIGARIFGRLMTKSAD